MAVAMLSLLVAPGLGEINVKLTADADKVDVMIGQTTTVLVWAQGTNAGLFSLAGDIVASGDSTMAAVPGTMAFSPLYRPTGFFTPQPGTPGVKGGWTGFGTQQTDWGAPDAGLGKADFVEVGRYTIVCVSTGKVTLTFVAKSVSGCKPLETDKTGVLGTITPVTITESPEPTTLSMLALGGLLLARRRGRGQ